MVKQRDISIDIIKFFAVFLIINSHADACYPKWSALATDGAIGDALFLFCSGYTLFWGQTSRFDNWYKRRICRIYPSVFACLIFSMLYHGRGFDTLTLEALGGGEFVIAIMCYYILLYVVHRWLSGKLCWVMCFTAALTLIAYWFFPYKYETSNMRIYGFSTYFRWIPYFAMMLLGAWVGKRSKNGVFKQKYTRRDPFLLLGCFLVFYGIQFLAKKIPVVAPWQIATVPFLAGIVYYSWRCSNADFFKMIYESRLGNWIIMAVGGVCLESYLIQHSFLTSQLNWLFPLNLPIIILEVLLASYVCRCLSRFIAQTFRTEDYEWRKIWAIK